MVNLFFLGVPNALNATSGDSAGSIRLPGKVAQQLLLQRKRAG